MGIVTEVGSKASTHFKVGDRAGIGCFVRACQVCIYVFLLGPLKHQNAKMWLTVVIGGETAWLQS